MSRKALIPSFLIVLSLFTFSLGFAGGKAPAENPKEVPVEVCPKCYSEKEVIPIVYGYPGKALMEQAQKGLVLLGGCIVCDEDPRWYCQACQNRW